jgi:hypothetical protein
VVTITLRLLYSPVKDIVVTLPDTVNTVKCS